MTVTPAQQYALFGIAPSGEVPDTLFQGISQSEGRVTVTIGAGAPVRMTLSPDGSVAAMTAQLNAPDGEWVDAQDTDRASYDPEAIAKAVAAGNRWGPQLGEPAVRTGEAVAVLESIPGDALLALTDADRSLEVAVVAAESVLASAKALHKLRRNAGPGSPYHPAWWQLETRQRESYLEDARVILMAIATTGNPFTARLPLAGPPTSKQAASVVKVFASGPSAHERADQGSRSDRACGFDRDVREPCRDRGLGGDPVHAPVRAVDDCFVRGFQGNLLGLVRCRDVQRFRGRLHASSGQASGR
jgi:hypothetical protein